MASAGLMVALLVLLSLGGSLEVEGSKCTGLVCQPGSRVQPNPLHKASSNGCGSLAISVSGEYDMTECCNRHDICYDTCGHDKEDCDQQFSACMNTLCRTFKVSERSPPSSSFVELTFPLAQNGEGCSQQAQMFSLGVTMFGCQSYRQSQRNACLCVSHKEL